MTKKIIWVFVLLFGISSAFVACKKKGCTDSAAKNYCEECKKDDGSCQYVSAEDLTGTWNVSGNCSSYTMSISGSGSSITFNKLYNNCYTINATLSQNTLTIPTQTINCPQTCGCPYTFSGSGTISAPSYNRIDIIYTMTDNGGNSSNCSITLTK